MRIVTFNCNGILTMPNYRPWFQLSTWPARLDYLQADIVCFQETKVTRKVAAKSRDLCVPSGWAAFWNFHPQKGYSGTVTYVRTEACIPRKAEQGITGALVPDRWDANTAIGGYPDGAAAESPVFGQIDAEGRAVVVDCGLFVLFNLYCPNETDESRRQYKLAYNAALAERAHNLLDAGREVIIVGDLNIAREPIDHCDATGRMTKDEFLAAHPARAWLDSFLVPQGRFHDITREHHPGRRGMYTVWNTVIDARPANYGCRLDYTLVSPGLLPWVKSADIQADVYGSDHCPVYLELHDSITAPDGRTLYLKDLLHGGETTKLPPLASCHWDEFSGRDLRSFFGGGASKAAAKKVAQEAEKAIRVAKEAKAEVEAGAADADVNPGAGPNGEEVAPKPAEPAEPSLADAFSALQDHEGGGGDASKDVEQHDSPAPSASPAMQKAAAVAASSAPTAGRRSSSAAAGPSSASASKAKKTAAASQGQMKLASFFAKPGAARATASPGKQAKTVDASLEDEGEAAQASAALSEAVEISPSKAASASSTDSRTTPEPSAAARVSSSLAWGSIFAPPPPPRCTGHNEPAKAWTVKKSGPNCGRKFWMCARPVGPGYDDKATPKGLIDPQYRCAFWKWDSDLKRSTSSQNGGSPSKSAAAGEGQAPEGSPSQSFDGPSFQEVAGTAPLLGSGDKRSTGPKGLREPPHKRVRQ